MHSGGDAEQGEVFGGPMEWFGRLQGDGTIVEAQQLQPPRSFPVPDGKVEVRPVVER